MEYEWDEAKRQWTLEHRGLDFAEAFLIYEASGKVTLSAARAAEERWQDIALVEVRDAILALVYTKRGARIRVISMRKASKKERQTYVNHQRD